MASLEELRLQLKKSQSVAKELSDKIRKAKQAAAESDLAAAVTPWMRAVAVRVYVMSEFACDAPLAYLRAKGRQAEADEIRSWCATLDADTQKNMTLQPAEPGKSLRQWAEAVRFTKDWKLVACAKKQNKKSIAPTPGAMLRYAATALASHGKKHSQYRWLQRVASRWGGGKGSFASGDRLTPEAFEKKASSRCLVLVNPRFVPWPRAQFCGRNPAPLLGSPVHVCV